MNVMIEKTKGFISYSFPLLIFFLFLIGCGKDDKGKGEKTISFTLTFKVDSYDKKALSLKEKFELDVKKVKKVKVTIKDEQGMNVGINKRIYKVSKTVAEKEAMFSFTVSQLKQGNYKITFIQFLAEDDEEIFYLPDEDDSRKDKVAISLPIYFDVSAKAGEPASIAYKDRDGKPLSVTTVKVIKQAVQDIRLSLGYVDSYGYHMYMVNSSGNVKAGVLANTVVTVYKQNEGKGDYKVIYSNYIKTNIVKFRLAKKATDYYKFEIAKPGYETRELAPRSSSTLEALGKMDKVVLLQNDIMIREANPSASPPQLQIGGGNFRHYDTVYWNHLPAKDGDYYHISKATDNKEGSIDLDRLEAKTDLALGNYDISINCYSKSSATEGILIVSIGDQKYYLKKNGAGKRDGSDLSNAESLSNKGKTFDITMSSATGKFSISVNDVDKQKVFFRIVKVYKRD